MVAKAARKNTKSQMFLLAKICAYVVTWHCPQDGDGRGYILVCCSAAVLATLEAAEVVQVGGGGKRRVR